MSPHSMAEAVVTEALAEREHLVQKESAKEAEYGAANDESSEGVALLGKRSRFDEEKEDTDELKKLWEPATTDLEWKQTAAVERTITMVYAQIESMIHQGLEAYHGWEIMSRDLAHAKEEIETKDRDIKRLRTFEEQSRTTVSNLLRAVETSKSDARDASRAVQMEARLRADLSVLRSEKDEALSYSDEYKRKVTLLEEELRLIKSKLIRVGQEKVKMERDSRAAISLARSLDSNSSADVDFHKRKVAELTIQVQAQQALTSEKSHQLDEMRRQMERSMSQNRLAHIRAEGTKNRNPRHST